jgi:hypothetical protein
MSLLLTTSKMAGKTIFFRVGNPFLFPTPTEVHNSIISYNISRFSCVVRKLTLLSIPSCCTEQNLIVWNDQWTNHSVT